MEIYLDLENTLFNDNKTLDSQGASLLKKLAEDNRVVILTTGVLKNAKCLFSIPNLEIVSTLENKVYQNNMYQFLPLNSDIVKDLLDSSYVYTIYGVHEDTVYIMKYQERMKSFYPCSRIQICSSFPSTISSII
ncbi:MAG: hypothetical protein K2K50_06130, partial [Anaeroplasmataceae bacterium]|nr:hypothetical protein [Anaeroplasmataceae bacterium]